MLTGSCLCKSVAYEVDAEPGAHAEAREAEAADDPAHPSLSGALALHDGLGKGGHGRGAGRPAAAGWRSAVRAGPRPPGGSRRHDRRR